MDEDTREILKMMIKLIGKIRILTNSNLEQIKRISKHLSENPIPKIK